MAARNKKHEINMDWVLKRLQTRAMAGEILAKFKKVEPDGSLTWDFTGATQADLALISDLGMDFYIEGKGENAVRVKKFKVKEPDIHAALMALGRHFGAFKDVIETVDGGTIADRLQAARARAFGPREVEKPIPIDRNIKQGRV